MSEADQDNQNCVVNSAIVCLVPIISSPYAFKIKIFREINNTFQFIPPNTYISQGDEVVILPKGITCRKT